MTITVETTRSDTVATIRFSKPPLNYACPALLRQIADAIDACDADPAVRCIVLASSGQAFCAGADLAGDDSLAGADGMATVADLYTQAKRLFARDKPMVAAVHGAAVGAGLGLALAADFRVAGPGARFSANFVRLGFHPGFALTHTLPRLVGVQFASWMMLSADRVKPDVALRHGLIDRMADDGQVEAAAQDMARQIADNAPLALVAVRQTLRAGQDDAIAAALAHEHAEQTRLKGTADYAEGVASVFERRPAHFTGR